jgi:transglutaminase-like putative cysteine protease
MSIATHAKMSREGRDTLWLLGALALSILPHVGHLPLWCALGTGAALAWRARAAWQDSPLPPRWVLVICLALSLALTLWTFRTLFGREAGVTLVTLLAGLKTLELRARRDAFVITSLGFFLILTQFLYSQSVLMAALMLVVLVGLLTSLVLAQRPTGRPPIWSAVKAACRSVVMGVPVMIALFVLFPRLGPLWSLPADAGQRTGLSDNIELGHVANLALDDSVAMRIRFFQGPPMAREMYFRGPVLDFFDGKAWHSFTNMPGAGLIERDERVEAGGQPLPYQITLEPSRITAVPLLEGTLSAAPTPPATSPQLRREGLSWIAGAGLTERSQIDAQYWSRVTHGPQTRSGLQAHWLQMPRGHNPRTLAWVEAFRAENGLGHADARTLSEALIHYIRRSGFRYTLSVGEEDDADLAKSRSNNPHLIDAFWLDRKAGFCEHFATAYVFVMRAMGVPSRVVTGYQGAELNPVDGLYVVRNSDAHAWAEIWLPGEGWTRVDPTAAVAPDRVERARQVFRHGNPFPGPLSNIDPAVWGRLRSYIDAGNHRWNTWVLQYSKSKQMDLLKDWGFASPNWVDLIRLAGGMLIGISLMGIAWLWWTRPRTPRTPWRRPLMRVHRALQASGFPVPTTSPAPAPALSWVPMLAHVRASEQLDLVRQQIQDALMQLDAMRYAPQDPKTATHRRERNALVERIEQLSQAWRTARRRDRAN